MVIKNAFLFQLNKLVTIKVTFVMLKKTHPKEKLYFNNINSKILFFINIFAIINLLIFDYLYHFNPAILNLR